MIILLLICWYDFHFRDTVVYKDMIKMLREVKNIEQKSKKNKNKNKKQEASGRKTQSKIVRLF